MNLVLLILHIPISAQKLELKEAFFGCQIKLACTCSSVVSNYIIS